MHSCVLQYNICIYRLDAESRKLRALESRGGPEMSAFERSEDATKGPQGALMHIVSMTRRLTGLELWQRMVTQTKRALVKWRQASISSERLSATGSKNQTTTRLSLSLFSWQRATTTSPHKTPPSARAQQVNTIFFPGANKPVHQLHFQLQQVVARRQSSLVSAS